MNHIQEWKWIWFRPSCEEWEKGPSSCCEQKNGWPNFGKQEAKATAHSHAIKIVKESGFHDVIFQSYVKENFIQSEVPVCMYPI